MRISFAPLDPTDLAQLVDNVVDVATAAQGGWRNTYALDSVRADVVGRLPAGIATPHHDLLSIYDGAGDRVGAIWIEHRVERGRAVSMILYLGIDQQFRRCGYARAALALAERRAAAAGESMVQLVVDTDNAAARALYASSGYHEVNVLLGKSVSTDPDLFGD